MTNVAYIFHNLITAARNHIQQATFTSYTRSSPCVVTKERVWKLDVSNPVSIIYTARRCLILILALHQRPFNWTPRATRIRKQAINIKQPARF